ncbi:MAG: hypothetical protein H0T62_02910 [Parachlamydiaceae bacterium]|nr:hypothetical protein [Parachlamydiaceae bacterium]
MVEIGCFAKALDHWKNDIPEEIMRYVFLVMNFCDTLSFPESATYEREWLTPIDDHQMRVMRPLMLLEND